MQVIQRNLLPPLQARVLFFPETEAAAVSEMFDPICWDAQRYTPEDSNFQYSLLFLISPQ
jgi:hypothetical protein